MNDVIRTLRGIKVSRIQVLFMVMMMMAFSVVPSFAQSAIEFDADELIVQSNSWIEVFLPILAIPFGISIALALITLVGGLIVGALKSVRMGR